MKRCVTTVVWIVLAASAALAADVRPGDDRSAVLRALGEPSGIMQLDGREYLLYERGRVDLVDGKVVETKLITQDQLDMRRAREREDAKARHMAALAAREARIAEGLSVRSQKLTDPGFLAKSPQQRVDYWRSFRATYPEVDVDGEYSLALRELQVELDTARVEADRRREIDRLEERVAQAEERARDAEREAVEAQRYQYGYGYYPVVYTPIYNRPTRPCGPVVKPAPHGSGVSVNVRVGNSFDLMSGRSSFDMNVPPIVSGSGYF